MNDISFKSVFFLLKSKYINSVGFVRFFLCVHTNRPRLPALFAGFLALLLQQQQE